LQEKPVRKLPRTENSMYRQRKRKNLSEEDINIWTSDIGSDYTEGSSIVDELFNSSSSAELAIRVLTTLRIFHWESAVSNEEDSYNIHVVLEDLYNTLEPLMDNLVEVTASNTDLFNVSHSYVFDHYNRGSLVSLLEDWIAEFKLLFDPEIPTDGSPVVDEIVVELKKAVYLLSSITGV